MIQGAGETGPRITNFLGFLGFNLSTWASFPGAARYTPASEATATSVLSTEQQKWLCWEKNRCQVFEIEITYKGKRLFSNTTPNTEVGVAPTWYQGLNARLQLVCSQSSSSCLSSGASRLVHQVRWKTKRPRQIPSKRTVLRHFLQNHTPHLS